MTQQSPPGIYLDKSIIQKDTHIPMFIVALFTTAETKKQPKCPLTDEWTKMWYRYTWDTAQPYKRANNVICSNKDGLEIIILNEVSQKEQDRYHIFYRCH